MKGNGEVSWCGVNYIIAGFQDVERTGEGVSVLLNDVWHSAVIDFGSVISQILWIKFKYSRVKARVVVEYGPNEEIGEERERFWNDMDRTMDRVGNGYRLCMLIDLNR